MKNQVLADIRAYAIAQLTAAYGYAGCAESDDKAVINSDDRQGHDIKIIIESKPED